MRVLVAAVPGSGKSTIMELVKKRLPGVKIVNVGGMIFEIAKKELGVKNRDEMRKLLTIGHQRKFQLMAARKIAKIRGDMVLDSHTAVKTPEGFIPGLSEKTAPLLKPDVIVLLEYRPRDIIERRDGDKSRRRDRDTPKSIEEHQQVSREFALDAADLIEAAVKIVDLRYPQKRKFEHTKKAAGEIVKLFKLQQK